MESKQYLVTLSVRNGHTTKTTHVIVIAVTARDAGDQAHETVMFLENKSTVVRVVDAVEMIGGRLLIHRSPRKPGDE